MPSEAIDACLHEGEEIFTCQQCGECCKGYGGTYVSRADIEAIAAYIGVDPARFKKKYCTQSGDRLLLIQQESGFCIFSKDKICSIHPVKPEMCRAWPFIRSVRVDPDNWEKMASMCPGICKGVPVDVVQRCVEAMLGNCDQV